MSHAEQAFERVENRLADTAEVTRGKLFGHPCLNVKGKAFAVRFHDDLVFKLGRERAAVLLEQHLELQLFDPSGKKRAMRDWVQSPTSLSAHFESWADEACSFVAANA